MQLRITRMLTQTRTIRIQTRFQIEGLLIHLQFILFKFDFKNNSFTHYLLYLINLELSIFKEKINHLLIFEINLSFKLNFDLFFYN